LFYIHHHTFSQLLSLFSSSTPTKDVILKPIAKKVCVVFLFPFFNVFAHTLPLILSSAPTLDDIYKNIMMNDESMVNVSKDVPVTTDKHDKRKVELSDFF